MALARPLPAPERLSVPVRTKVSTFGGSTKLPLANTASLPPPLSSSIWSPGRIGDVDVVAGAAGHDVGAGLAVEQVGVAGPDQRVGELVAVALQDLGPADARQQDQFL